MAFVWQVKPALTLFSAYMKAFMDAQSPPVTYRAIAYTFTLQQYTFTSDIIPIFLIAVKPVVPGHSSRPGAIEFSAHVDLHRIVARSAAGIAELGELDTMCAFAAQVDNDYRMVAPAYNADGGGFNRVLTGPILVGDDNPLQQSLNMDDQGASLAAISQSFQLSWNETLG